MKIYSVNVSNSFKKGITLKRKRDLLEFVSFDRKGGRIYVSAFFTDIMFNSVLLPPTDNEETLDFLTKQRLSGFLEEKEKYIFKRFKLQEKTTEAQETLYEIFALPESHLLNVCKILNLKIDSVDLCTADVFSLVPLSYKIGSTKTVFHFYADEEKILVCISSGKTPFYIRPVMIDTQLKSRKLTDVFYENFNLTYTFAVQNKRLSIDKVILSGKAAFDEELFGLVKELTGKTPTVLSVENFVKNMSQEHFQEYILQIGTALLDRDFNFIPYSILKKRDFDAIIRYLSLALSVITVFLVIKVYGNTQQIRDYQFRIKKMQDNISKEEQWIQKNFPEEKSLYFRKVSTLMKQKDHQDPLYLFEKFSELFKILNEKEIKIRFEGNRFHLFIQAENSFSSISQEILFKNKLNELLNSFTDFNVSYNIKESEPLNLVIHLSLQGKTGD